MENIQVYLKEWSDIQNIVIEKEYNKFILDELSLNEEDVCERLNQDNCTKAANCMEWKSNCVNKRRVKRMHTENVMITSKNYKIKFRVLDSMFMSKVQLTSVTIDMYYCIVESTVSGNVYVLFSSGIVLTKAELYDNKELNDRMALLRLKIVQLARLGKRIILGGHSMGSVLAMYAGWEIYSHNKSVFTNSVVILGTAGAKWMTPEMSDYATQPNVVQFISGELRVAKKSSKLLLDCFQIDGDSDFTAFPNYKILYTDTEDGTYHVITPSEAEYMGYTLTHTGKGSSQCKKLHMWKYYMEILQDIYGHVMINRTASKSRRSHSRSNRRTILRQNSAVWKSRRVSLKKALSR